jgi:hypothetical protein
MNSITFNDKTTFTTFLNTLALESVMPYTVDGDTLTITSEDIHSIIDIAVASRLDDFSARFDNEEPFDGFRTDAEADADALASAGFGTDEDYGGGVEDIGGYDE